MTEWQPRRDLVMKNLTIWRACRTLDGTRETDIAIYGTQEEALNRARELNANEKKRPRRRQPLKAQRNKFSP